jgi:hypothetical protein
MDPGQGGRKTCGSNGSGTGSGTLKREKGEQLGTTFCALIAMKRRLDLGSFDTQYLIPDFILPVDFFSIGVT